MILLITFGKRVTLLGDYIQRKALGKEADKHKNKLAFASMLMFLGVSSFDSNTQCNESALIEQVDSVKSNSCNKECPSMEESDRLKRIKKRRRIHKAIRSGFRLESRGTSSA
tara:strand:- start:872 stop:1207 length:336 start_codon:yes stop_codon:yes gene_type:complete